MTTGNDPETDARSSQVPTNLPSPAALIGVWARATITLLDLAFEWWKLLPEAGYAEDPRQGVWSTTVYFPRRDHDITVEPSSVTTALGGAVPGAEVVVKPTLVERDVGQGNKELEVLVRRLPLGLRHHFVVTIRDRDDPSCVREYGLDFGVPGAAV
jgi:hypothetical protein